MKVLRLLAVRLLLALPILFALLLFTFMLVRLSGNEPVGLLVGPTASAEEIAAVTAKLKLDQPIWRQFLEFVVLVAQGDLGRSWLSDAPVLDELLLRLPATLEMVLIGAALGALMGVPAGLAAAMRPNSIFDHVSRVLALIGFGMPTIFLGLVLVFVFFFVLQWAPPPMGRIDLIISQPPTVTGSYSSTP
jgi:peptide/nickel transport system permease protein